MLMFDRHKKRLNFIRQWKYFLTVVCISAQSFENLIVGSQSVKTTFVWPLDYCTIGSNLVVQSIIKKWIPKLYLHVFINIKHKGTNLQLFVCDESEMSEPSNGVLSYLMKYSND